MTEPKPNGPQPPEPSGLGPVFKALADENRRRILDILRAQPGITAGELAESFDFTRFAVRKHLLILEEANLVVVQKDGRQRRLHLNAVPLQEIYARWLSAYDGFWSSYLTDIKHNLEKGEPIMTQPPYRQLYVTYIKSTPDKVWQAITEPTFTEQFFLGLRIHTQLDGPIEYHRKDEQGVEQKLVAGKILEVETQKKLVHTFKAFIPEVDPGDEESTVTYELESMGEMTKLTLTHVFTNEDSTFRQTSEGWPMILSGLKTLVETGEGMI